MRAFLNQLYRVSSWASALCLATIAILVGAQLAARILDGALSWLGMPVTGFVILSLDEICGFLLAAASFLALAGTLKAGAHIRVTLLVSAFGEAWRRWFELWSLAFASLFCASMTWNIGSFAFYSWRFNDISSGLVAVPLAWPQAAMAIGLLILTVAFVDELLIVVRGGRPTFRASEDAITLGKEG